MADENNDDNNNDNKNNDDNNVDSNIDQLVNVAEKYLVKARQKILDILVNEYKFAENDAKRTEESIYISTRLAMREKYAYKEKYAYGDKYSLSENENYDLIHFPDFIAWYQTALNVPYYHSLGDTIGYKNADWEFNNGEINAPPEYTNELIYQFISLGGVNDLDITNWLSSDDTILYLATMDVLTDKFENIDQFGEKIREAYLKAEPMIMSRHPGVTTINSLETQKNIEWNKLPYNGRAIGNGSAMRSGCIGIFFPGEHNRKKLISLAVESSRITHNSTIAILGSVVAALFTAYALEKVPINRWPHKLLKLLKSDLIDQYMQKSRPNEYPMYQRDKILYTGQWQKYIDLFFNGLTPRTDKRFMQNAVLRYKYLADNFSKGCDIPGSCGDDTLIMAYHALLQSDGTFEKIIVYSILHPGDSDTVGSIALGWFGAYYHSPRNEMLIGYRFDELEFHDKLYDLFEQNVTRMAKVYYYDIYLNVAKKYLKQATAKSSSKATAK